MVEHNDTRDATSTAGLLRSDLEEAALAEQTQTDAAQQILHQMGEMITAADRALEDLDNQDVLGSAIVRGCQDLADTIGNLAQQMDRQSDKDRRVLAAACLQDANNTLLLQEEAGMSSSNSANALEKHSSRELQEFSQLSEDDVMSALVAAQTLLKDVEATLRQVEQDEAEEIADVALTVARIFVQSLQSIHSNLAPEDLLSSNQTNSNRRSLQPSDRIEMLDEDSEDDDEVASTAKSTKKNKQQRVDHLRVIWPPLGPAVASALDWGQETATQQPFLAVTLGLTLWPAAVIATLMGAPLVLADGFAQDLYSNFQEGPIIQGLERSAAQLYQTGRLSLLCGKLVGRQTLRVASRQVKRHGGVGKIAQDLGGVAVDRVTHPVETVEILWSGISWGVGLVRDTVDQLADREREETVQDLQQ